MYKNGLKFTRASINDNDSRPPMSELGKALFDMMEGINRAYMLTREIPPEKPMMEKKP